VRRQTSNPRALHADFHHHQATRMPPAQGGEAGSGVGDGFLLEDLAVGVQHTDGVLAVTKVESDGLGR